MSKESAAKKESSVAQIPSGPELMVVEATITAWGPERIFAYWTVPALLTAWWPHAAEVEPRLGGVYHLRWPAMNWHLFGEYVEFAPGKLLAFTWRWEHEPEAPTRTVRVDFTAAASGGTHLTVRHVSYTDAPGEQEARAGNIEGWLHFLGRLGSLADHASVEEFETSPQAENEGGAQGEHNPADTEGLRR